MAVVHARGDGETERAEDVGGEARKKGGKKEERKGMAAWERAAQRRVPHMSRKRQTEQHREGVCVCCVGVCAVLCVCVKERRSSGREREKKVRKWIEAMSTFLSRTHTLSL